MKSKLIAVTLTNAFKVVKDNLPIKLNEIKNKINQIQDFIN